MHVHIGAVEVFQFTATLLLVGFLIRSFAAKFSDTPFGKALAFIY